MTAHMSPQTSGLYEYKIHGIMADLDPEVCAQVYVDTIYRKKWDTYAMGTYTHVHTGMQQAGGNMIAVVRD